MYIYSKFYSMIGQLQTPLTSDLKERFRKATSKNGQSMAEVSRQLIIDYCNREELLRTKLD